MAVDHIDARIKDGCVFGLIGTNGAGKSTFLRMACGVLKPDEGTIQIDGEMFMKIRRSRDGFSIFPTISFSLETGRPRR